MGRGRIPPDQLPRLGDWDGPIFGQLGVLATDGTRVECHLCGLWFKLLASHVRQAHGFSGAAYRSLVGLKTRTALAGPSLRAVRHALAEPTLKPYRERIGQLARSVSREERSARMKGRTLRLEARLDPAWQQSVKEAARRSGATRKPRYASGALRMPHGDPSVAGRKGAERRRELLRDPAYRAALAKKISDGRGGRVETSCTVCGATFRIPRSWIGLGQGKVCGSECKREWELQRRRVGGHPYREIAARLAAVDPARLEALPAPMPLAVRLYYGLVDGRPWTQRAIAKHLGLPFGVVRRWLLGPAVLRLLGLPPALREQTATATCAVCGQPLERAARQLRDRGQTTCGPVCLSELRRRQLARRPPLSAAIHAKAVEASRQKLADPELHEQWRSRLRAAGRRRGRPNSAELAALPRDAFEALADDAGELVRRYYGLGGYAAHTQRSLAAMFHIDGSRVSQLIAGSVARLFAMESAELPRGGFDSPSSPSQSAAVGVRNASQPQHGPR